MRWPWDKPHELTLGSGRVINGCGVKAGKPFVFIRPVRVRGFFGQRLPAQTVTVRRGDVVFWLDNPEGARAMAELFLRAAGGSGSTSVATQVAPPIREET